MVPWIVAAIAVMFWLGFFLGESRGSNAVRREAVRVDVAHYTADEAGCSVFAWNDYPDMDEFTDAEQDVLYALAEEKDLTVCQVMKQALRVYQLVATGKAELATKLDQLPKMKEEFRNAYDGRTDAELAS